MRDLDSLMREWLLFLRWMAHMDPAGDREWQAGRGQDEILQWLHVKNRWRSIELFKIDVAQWCDRKMLAQHADPSRLMVSETALQHLQMLDNPIFMRLAQSGPRTVKELGAALRSEARTYAHQRDHPEVNHTTYTDPARFEISAHPGVFGKDTDETTALVYDQELERKLEHWQRRGLVLLWWDHGHRRVAVHPTVQTYCGFPRR